MNNSEVDKAFLLYTCFLFLTFYGPLPRCLMPPPPYHWLPQNPSLHSMWHPVCHKAVSFLKLFGKHTQPQVQAAAKFTSTEVQLCSAGTAETAIIEKGGSGYRKSIVQIWTGSINTLPQLSSSFICLELSIFRAKE